MHENDNNVMRPRTRTRPTKRGRERERDLKIWPRDHVGLENLTSLGFIKFIQKFERVISPGARTLSENGLGKLAFFRPISRRISVTVQDGTN